MASEKFIFNLNKLIGKQLKKVLAGEPEVRSLGSEADQHKGLGDDLKTKFIPFRKSSYSAEEFLSVRIPVSDPNISYMDFVTPIVNIKDKSIQGVASMVTLVKHPIPETFVQRMVGFSYACERSTKIPSLHRWGT